MPLRESVRACPARLSLQWESAENRPWRPRFGSSIGGTAVGQTLVRQPRCPSSDKLRIGRCLKTFSRAALGQSPFVMLEQPGLHFPRIPARRHPGGTIGRGGNAHSGAFPCHSSFCVRNRSDPKATERDAKSASISLVRTCGFQQREYWGLSQAALFNADSWSRNCSGVLLSRSHQSSPSGSSKPRR